MTTGQFTGVLLQAFWPLLLVGLIGTSLLFRDLVKRHRNKKTVYRVER